jgi:phospholipid/cholesterol/gamma-HCH transport system permease protein
MPQPKPSPLVSIPATTDPRLRLDSSTQPAVLHLNGVWNQGLGLPDADALINTLKPGADLALSAEGLERWDTSIAAFVARLERSVNARGGHLHSEGLPAGAQRLMKLIRLNPTPAVASAGHEAFFVRVGKDVLRRFGRISAWFAMAGAAFAALVRFLSGRARVPWSDIVEQIHECGPRALPIVTLLSFLIGGITAFVGVIQLRMFGAEIYVADLVGMGMLLEMGALMTGIIMAGRAGAAFAAAIGTMQTNEEVDALQTLGFDPIEFLVMPRMLALTLMTPLLTLYADVLGILGGAFVGMTMLDISPATYFVQTGNAIHLADASKGLIKSVCFGAVIGFSGCLRGLECGRSAQSVGHATTSAVVTAIVLIVLADAFTTVLFFVYDGML